MSYSAGRVTFNAANVDAFGRLRISEMVNQFESKFTYGNEEYSYDTTTSTGGVASFVPNEAAYRLTTTASAGSRVLRQSYRYFQYHPGRSQLIMMTGIFGGAISNCVKRIGYYDDNDGLFFLQNGTAGLGVCRRTSTSGTPVDNIILQSQWNIDAMDGTGPSGITIDPTKTHIFVIDFQWLGVGAVRFGLVIDGVLLYVHQMNHANALTTVYMKSAWLPTRYEIVNVGVAPAAGAMTQICSHVASESGMEERGSIRTVNTASSVSVSVGSWTPIIGINVSSTLNSVPFRGAIRLVGMEAIVTGSSPVIFKIVEAPIITGANWTTVNAASPITYDEVGTSYTGGIDRISFSGSSGKAASGALAPEDIVGSAGSTFYLVAKSVGGSSTVYGTINWREIL